MEPSPEVAGEHSQRPSAAADTERPLTRQALASLRSLIVNSSTPSSLISSVLETLTRHLQSNTDRLILHHVIKLLTELSFHRGHLSGLIFDSVQSFAADSTRLAVESLDSLASISKHEKLIDDNLFVSLCFGASSSTQLWLLRNAERFLIGPNLLFTMFIGFTKDPFPLVRKAALDGLVSLSRLTAIEDPSLIEGCYYRAVELLGDSEGFVRSAAVRTVSEWGQMLIVNSRGTCKRSWSDAVFIQLSSMARDMSTEVKVEAFQALGKIEMVSVDILLQTLSKKVLATLKESKSSHQECIGELEVSGSSAAGAILHGIEDEYHEVRNATCYSMQRLTILSSEFAGGAISLLMDMLNDDSIAVRLQALETMYAMAACGHLFVQIIHMPMFLGSLSDSSALIRNAVRKVLKVVKLPNLELFRLAVHGLVENLERNHQDEAEIFSVLFHMGQHHGNFVISVINEVSQEIEPSSDGKLDFDCARTAALLVLAISAPLSRENNCDVPPSLFSYAVTFLGRISDALANEVDQSNLLAYLSKCSQCIGDSLNILKGEVVLPTLANRDIQRQKGSEKNSSDESSVQMDFEASEMCTQKMKKIEPSHADYQLEINLQLLKSINVILAKVKDIWSMIKLGLLNEALKILRDCEEQLDMFGAGSVQSPAYLACMRLYLQILGLLAQIWVCFHPTRNYSFCRVGELDFLLGKLEMKLRDMRCRFTGFSREEHLHILELVLVFFVLELSKVEVSCHQVTLRKLSALLSSVELLQEGSIEPSSFVSELKKFMCEVQPFASKISPNPFMFRNILDQFCLRKFQLSESTRLVSAEVDVPGNDSENPLYFVQGLPVAIPIAITLKNIGRESRLWLNMVVGQDSMQFVFLDLNSFQECNELMQFTQNTPFYRTPKAVSFTVRISIGIECLFEDCEVTSRCGGPKCELTYLGPEKEVHLSSSQDRVI